jgi:hypothetical protein
VLFFSLNFQRDQQRWVAVYVVIIITLFASIRGFTGTDTYSYHLIFSENISTPLPELMGSTEPLFALFLKASSMVTSNSFAFIAFISIVQGVVLVKLVLTSKKPVVFLLMYIAVFYFEFEFNILRAGTAILLLVLATRYIDCKQGREFYIYAGAAVLMHYSTLLVLLPLVYIKEDGLRTRIFFTTLTLLLALILFNYLIDQSRLGIFTRYFYTVKKEQSSQFGFGFYVTQLLYLIFYFSIIKTKRFAIQTFLLIAWLTIMWLSLSFAYVDRVNIILSAIFLFLGIEVEVENRRNQVRTIALAGIFVVSLFGNLTTMEGVSTSTELDSNYAASPYIPHRFFWEE